MTRPTAIRTASRRSDARERGYERGLVGHAVEDTLTLATSAGSDPRVSPDIFSSQSTETPWEWAKARRQWFKTPAKDLLGGAFLALPGLAVRFSAGNPNWVRATVEAVATSLIGAAILPQLESASDPVAGHKCRAVTGPRAARD